MYHSGDNIIPSNEDDGLIPHGNILPDLTCNIVILFNIVMGEHETKLAQEELALRTIKAIADRIKDKNNYSIQSNPVEFSRNNPNLYIGQKVIYDDGFGYQLTTRVIKLITKLDYPIIQNITVGNQAIKGTISQLKEDVSNILTGNFSGSGLNNSQVSDIVKNYVGNRFLRKDTPDTAQKLITFLEGIALTGGKGIDAEGRAKLLEVIAETIRSYDFDATTETGFGITRRKDGKYQLSITDLIVWGKALFNELEIRKLSYVGGNMVFSSCGSKIMRVEELADAYRCYFYMDDGTTATTNLWKVGDQARCQTFNIREGKYEGVANRTYWRLVTAVGDDYVDLSKADCEEGSDAPMAGDTIVQFGSRTDTDRMGLIHVVVSGEEASAVIWYYGVNSYTLDKRRTAIISPRQVVFSTKMYKVMNYDGTIVPMELHLGAWEEGKEYYYYNSVTHGGRRWLCVAADGKPVTSEPKEGNPDWLLQVDKGEKGDEPVTVRIWGDNFIRNGQGSVTLTATVEKGNEDITDRFTTTDFSWERTSGNPEYDREWNNRHKGIGRTVTITAQDIFKRATFDCILTI